MNAYARAGRIGVIAMLLIAGAELLLRGFVASPSRQTFDPELGFVYLPHSRIFHTAEGNARTQLNKLGLNSAPLPTDSTGTRVLVLGDSYTEALQVSSERNFTSLAAAQTRTHVINAGRSGLGPAHYPTVLQRFAPLTEPDLVIVCLTQGDIADAAGTPREIIRDPQTGEITAISVQPSANNRIRRYIEPIIQRSALVTVMMRRAAVFASDISWREQADTGTKSAAPGLVNEELRFQFKTLARHTRLALIYIPTLIYGTDGSSKESLASQDDHAVFRTIAEQLGLALFDAGPAMRAAYARDGYPLSGFDNSRLGQGHLNIQGHTAIAPVLARAIESLR